MKIRFIKQVETSVVRTIRFCFELDREVDKPGQKNTFTVIAANRNGRLEVSLADMDNHNPFPRTHSMTANEFEFWKTIFEEIRKRRTELGLE